MKLKSLALASLALIVCASAPAKGKKKVKKNAKAEVKVDTVSVDMFSYSLGMSQTLGLKKYLSNNMGVDTTYMADFLRGYQEAWQKSGDARQAAYVAGLNLCQQVQKFLPGITNEITGNADSAFINKELFNQGFVDGVNGNLTKLSADSAAKIMQKQMVYYEGVTMERKYGQNRKDGEAFLAANSKKDSVVTLKSGLQYKILKKGTGALPTEDSKVTVDYEGRLIDGKVFDSSYKRKKPATFPLNGVIKGWTEALKLMPVGSIWEIYIPQELAYGSSQQSGQIPPFSTLIFKVELKEIAK